MKFTVEASEIKAALSAVGDVIRAKSTVPILTHVLVSASGRGKKGKLSLAGTNLDQDGRTYLECATGKGGEICVDAAALKRVLAPLAGPVSFELGKGRRATANEADRLKVTCRRAYSELPTLPAGELTFMPAESEGDDPIAIDAATLSAALGKVAYAMNTTEDRFYLNGVRFERGPDNGELNLVATDGHRISTIALNQIEWPFAAITVPGAAVRDLIRFCDRAGKAVDVGVMVYGKDKLSIETEQAWYLTKLVDGEYPNWREIMPSTHSCIIEFAPKVFLTGLKVVTALNTEKYNSVGLRAKQDDELDMQSGQTSAEARDTIDARVEFVEGAKSPQIAFFNSRYLEEAIGHVAGTARIYLNGADDKAVIESEERDLRQVVMPLKGVWHD